MNRQKFERFLSRIHKETGIHIYQPNKEQPHYLYYVSTWIYRNYDEKAEMIETIKWCLKELLAEDEKENMDDIHINEQRGTLSYTDETLYLAGKAKEKADIEYHLSQGGKWEDIYPVEGRIADMHYNKLVAEIWGIKNFKQ